MKIKPYDPEELVNLAYMNVANSSYTEECPLSRVERLPVEIFDEIEYEFRRLAVQKIEESDDDILPDSLDFFHDFDPDADESEMIRRSVVDVWMWCLKSAFTNSDHTRELMLEWITKNMLEE